MKANELRIGNRLLIVGSLREECIIRTISDTLIGYETETRKGGCRIEWLQPIPLTEEWLLKFGYELSQGHYIISGHLIWKCNDLLMCDKNGIVLKHVHQLQNLYFSLTGCELEINLNNK